jgi:hypothetical protein
MLLRQENVDVEQRDMDDPVLAGLMWGIFLAVFVVFGGTLVATSNSYEWMTTGIIIFYWNLIITALILGLFVYTYTLTNFIYKQPKQIDSKVI